MNARAPVALLLLALSACGQAPSAAPSEADALDALRTAYRERETDAEAMTDDQGRLLAYQSTASPRSQAVAGFSAAPSAVTLIRCQALAHVRNAWTCAAGVSLEDGNKTWGDWRFSHTPRDGWQAARLSVQENQP